MHYDISLWRSYQNGPDMRTSVEATDPVTAALLLMDRFGLRSAAMILVFEGSTIVSEFMDVNLDAASAAPACAVSYDVL